MEAAREAVVVVWAREQVKAIKSPIYSDVRLVDNGREKCREGQKCQRWSLPMKDMENVWYGEPVGRG